MIQYFDSPGGAVGRKLAQATERVWRYALKEAKPTTTHLAFVSAKAQRIDGFDEHVADLVATAPDAIVNLHQPHPAAHEAARTECSLLACWDGLTDHGYVIPKAAMGYFLKFRATALNPEALDKLPPPTVVNLWGMATGNKIVSPIRGLFADSVLVANGEPKYDKTNVAHAPRLGNDCGHLLWAIKPTHWATYDCIERYYAIQAGRRFTKGS